ncbi:leucyl aminopeptidase [Acidithiobacillus marinus]|uniref:Probable cytosol aminopeptidase n=1 Tax=Acidithiobacillus marinus TaxID=187490 RepID=A0A2I1DKB6_9PROT|nr:leucyl aminopeptidase [Acidithiobacillus marinus]PKY10296.1 leucyl aminopeptidase [Acidithiobacillus marinus]
MEIAIHNHNPSADKQDCIIVGVYEQGILSPAATLVDVASAGAIQSFLATGDFTGQCGETQILYKLSGLAAPRVMVLGLGTHGKMSDSKFCKAIQGASKALRQAQIVQASFYLLDTPVARRSPAALSKILVQTVMDSDYQFDHHKEPSEKPRRSLSQLHLHLAGSAEEEAAVKQACAEAQATSRAVAWAKDLANEPGNVCTPTWLADQAQNMAERTGIKSTILGPDAMEALGMRLLLGVAQGSRQEPRLIILEYWGGSEDQAPIVFVGKGLTFDAGGISLKPADKMDEMKYDMCGGASALAVIQAAAELKLPLNIISVVPASENLPDGQATKPGDIHKSMKGLTVEIINTDAEGRLILADALTYVERFEPDVVIDMATLTGACIVALGHQTAAVLGNNEGLVHDLIHAGKESMDRAWELPLYDEYQDQLKSAFADLSNVGGRPAGTITAACFLSRFTENYHWAHLDIAGVAWKSGENKGATGRPVSLLVEYLLHRVRQSA